ncbi:uncharacterized protein PAC_05604 [Phialocephala subalpina]|uniref:Calcium-independent phospholipase A2 n=1 Tax=Phialocephala subalpina TaxID=576137 RepID=A0A1L7WSH7_9HELO|nr:uncharacterized protein PAC_05604 [Phialocephala subalpina]
MTRLDSTWLSLRAGLGDLSLQEHVSAYNLFNNFSSQTEQRPQMIALIGQKAKSLAMRNLRFCSGTFEGNKNGEVHLRADPNTFKDDSPVLFADCEMHNLSSLIKVDTEKTPGNVVRRPLEWHRGISQPLDPSSLARLVYSKIIAPFSTILCFFAQDLDGLAAVAEVLAAWLINFSSRPSDLPHGTYPRVLIFTPWESSAPFDETISTKAFMQILGREAEKKLGLSTSMSHGKLKKAEFDRMLSVQFGGMRVLAYPGPKSSSRTWKTLKARLYQESAELQARRKAAQVAFSACHVRAFFQSACVHFCSDIVTPFSFIRASRAQDLPSVELQAHLSNFLKSIELSQVLNFAIPVIASALVFDAYPPGMHAFHPLLVFKEFFLQTCLLLDPFKNGDSYSSDISSQFANAVEIAFCQYAFDVIKSAAFEGDCHRKVLLRFKRLWKDFHRNLTCLACLSNVPENTLLPCSHALCTSCTKAHGKACAGEPWTFWFDACPLCGHESTNKFLLKPDTAGVRAIIAEGGGIRGVIPLAFLTEIESAIELPMSIQEHFDIAVGSSSGALIILGMFTNRWSVSECTKQFQNLSAHVFRKRRCLGFPVSSLGILRRPLEILVSCATDSRYSSTGINEALTEAFGSEFALFDASCGGTKVAVVATTTDNTSTCIFSNYNGPEKRAKDCGYKLIRPADKNKEFRTWQAARASSAAPPYFKSFQGFQDGGLGGHNNPINLALWEQDTIWCRQKKQPDIVLSLGTGFKRTSDPDSESTQKPSFFQGRCVPRLFRSFLNFFVGETRWQELQNSLPVHARNRYHRMNVEFYGDEPDLDDLQVMPNLSRQATIQALSNDDVQRCADNLLASLFYLELKDQPTFDNSLYTCRGRILCRIGPSHQALRPLANRLKTLNANFYLDFEQRVPCMNDESHIRVEAGGEFSCPISFKVTSLEDFIDVKIDKITMRARSISNCPYQINTLIQDEGLDCVFGSRKKRRPPQPEMVQRDAKRVKF